MIEGLKGLAEPMGRYCSRGKTSVFASTTLSDRTLSGIQCDGTRDLAQMKWGHVALTLIEAKGKAGPPDSLKPLNRTA